MQLQPINQIGAGAYICQTTAIWTTAGLVASVYAVALQIFSSELHRFLGVNPAGRECQPPEFFRYEAYDSALSFAATLVITGTVIGVIAGLFCSFVNLEERNDKNKRETFDFGY